MSRNQSAHLRGTVSELLWMCEYCHFPDYYAGKGAGKNVCRAFNVCHCDETAHAYEWSGSLEYVSALGRFDGSPVIVRG
jgi:hypothetical protein